MRIITLLLKIAQKLKFPYYDSFVLYNGWSAYNNGLHGIKIGRILFISGTLAGGVREAGTPILSLPDGLTSIDTYQYLHAVTLGNPGNAYLLRMLNTSQLCVDNNFPIGTSGHISINGFVILSGGGILLKSIFNKKRMVAA